MKTKTLKSIEILETKEIQCRYQVRDTEFFTESMHYDVFLPGANMAEQTQELKDISVVVWTPAVVAAYKADNDANTR
jgi:hypothetical protein